MDEAFLDVSGAGRRLGDAARDRRVPPRPGVRRAGHHLLGRRGRHQVRRQAGLHPRQARRAAASSARPRSSTSCTRCRSGRCGGSAPRPRRRCCGWGCAPSATSRTCRRAPCERAVGAAAGAHLHELAWGRDPRRVVPDEPEKSTGAEETFGTDVDDPAVIHRELLRLSERTAGRLRSAGHLARTVSIKVRFADFATITRSRTLDVPTDVGQELYDTARALFDALGLDRARIRLVGVRAERLVDAGLRRPAARARRPRARPPRRRARRRPRGPPVRCRRGPAGHPARSRGPAPVLTGGFGRVQTAVTGPGRVIADRLRRGRRALAFRTPRRARILGVTVGGMPPTACLALAHLEVDVPLSEHEQRLLEQIERALVDDDPKFASSVRTGDRRLKARRRLQLGGAARRRRPGRPGRRAGRPLGARRRPRLPGDASAAPRSASSTTRPPPARSRPAAAGRPRGKGARRPARPRAAPPAAEEPPRGALPPPLRPVATRLRHPAAVPSGRRPMCPGGGARSAGRARSGAPARSGPGARPGGGARSGWGAQPAGGHPPARRTGCRPRAAQGRRPQHRPPPGRRVTASRTRPARAAQGQPAAAPREASPSAAPAAPVRSGVAARCPAPSARSASSRLLGQRQPAPPRPRPTACRTAGSRRRGRPAASRRPAVGAGGAGQPGHRPSCRAVCRGVCARCQRHPQVAGGGRSSSHSAPGLPAASRRRRWPEPQQRRRTAPGTASDAAAAAPPIATGRTQAGGLLHAASAAT